MLQRAAAGAEPGVVGDIQDPARPGCGGGQLREQRFIADQRLDAGQSRQGEGSWRRAGKAFGLAFLVYGATLVVGAASGGDDPLRPLAPLTGGGTAQAEKLPFKRIASLTELRSGKSSRIH